jgi:hypothetical protein
LVGRWAADDPVFLNNHYAVEAVLGPEKLEEVLRPAGRRSAYFWCEEAARHHGMSGVEVFRLYLRRITQRGWGQRRARASLAISGPGRAYSVARAGRGRTDNSSASATAGRPRRDRAPTSEAQAALSIHLKLTMRSFRTPFRVRLGHPSQVLGQEAEQHIRPFLTRLY